MNKNIIFLYIIFTEICVIGLVKQSVVRLAANKVRIMFYKEERINKM